MRLDQALIRCNVEIVTQKQDSADSATLMLRVKDPAVWAEVIREFLITQNTLSDKKWSTDVSRVYFLDPQSRSIRYLWRVVLKGAPKDAAEVLGQTAIRVLSQGVEVTSQPLVGRVNAAPGSTKGAHSIGAASGLVAEHFKVGA
jgi:hypothetical protein